MKITRLKGYLTVLGTSCMYLAMGLYFAAGNTGVYLTSYLIYRTNSDMKLDDSIWFLSLAGFSALLLPLGGWLGNRYGVRTVCLAGGILQSCGIFATYWALDTTFFNVVLVYGGSFMVSLACCYTAPMVNVCKWHPKHKGLVTGIGAASMAVAPTLFTPLITAQVNPLNVEPNSLGLFDNADVLDRTKQSTLFQGYITLSLFLVGVALMFPAPESGQQSDATESDKSQDEPKRPDNNYPSCCCDVATTTITVSKLDLLSAQHRDEPSKAEHEPSIEPMHAFKTLEFWLLSLKVLISELIFIYLLFVYKPFGQTFIQDDYFLSAVGAACAISNTVGRLTMGHVKDKFGYKAVSIPLSGIAMLFVTTMPFTRTLHKYIYGTWVVLAVGAVGSQYALIPSAAHDSFGDRYASVNIGFVYMSTVIATVSSALLSQHLTSLVGWEGMIYLIGFCAAVDFVSTFFMPSNPRQRLAKRYEQFYVVNKYNDLAKVRTVPGQLVKTTPNVPIAQLASTHSGQACYYNRGFLYQFDQVYHLNQQDLHQIECNNKLQH
ncbi:hypothetical protein GZH46_01022, partial [Fragariocoptes setiger]